MASYQYIYTMQGLKKAYPGGKEVLGGIEQPLPRSGSRPIFFHTNV